MKTKIKYMLFLISIATNAQLAQQTKTYEYDDLNRLVKVIINDEDSKEYVYDNLGNRIQVHLETLDIQTETLENTITVYPNPTSQLININLPDRILQQNVEVSIYDINGRIISTDVQRIQSTTYTVDVGAFLTGVYLIRIVKDDEKWSQMFIKK